MSTMYGSFAVPAMLASPDDYTTWNDGTPGPANISRYLKAVTRLVLSETQGAIYDVDDQGFATDTQTKQALADATCIQAAAWIALGIDPNLGGVPQVKTVRSKRLASAQIDYAGADQNAAAAAAALTSLVPEAADVLQMNNLLGWAPYGRG